ncbi:MAG: CAP domain-containing protein [Solirubrobacterales bacterium]
MKRTLPLIALALFAAVVVVFAPRGATAPASQTASQEVAGKATSSATSSTSRRTARTSERRPKAMSSYWCSFSSRRPGTISRVITRRAVLCAINRERAKRGLRKLRPDGKLRRAAVRHSSDMKRRKFFSHDSPSGSSMSSRIKRTGYVKGARSWRLAENLGWGTGSYGSVQGLTKAWMNSPGHRRNILDPQLREIGVGVVWGIPKHGVPGTGAIITTDFGTVH